MLLLLAVFKSKYSLMGTCTRILHLYEGSQHYDVRKPPSAHGKPYAICRLLTDLPSWGQREDQHEQDLSSQFKAWVGTSGSLHCESVITNWTTRVGGGCLWSSSVHAQLICSVPFLSLKGLVLLRPQLSLNHTGTSWFSMSTVLFFNVTNLYCNCSM